MNLRRTFEVGAIVALFALCIAPFTKPLWAQALPQAANVQIVNSASALTFSQVTTSSSSDVLAVSANVYRKFLIIQNISPSPIYWGLTSPVSATTAFQMYSSGSITFDKVVPSNTIYLIGSIAGSQKVNIGEGN